MLILATTVYTHIHIKQIEMTKAHNKMTQIKMKTERHKIKSLFKILINMIEYNNAKKH